MRQDLTEYELELLGILQEECAEVIQIISKIRRFGLYDYNPADPAQTPNKARLVMELGDTVGVIEMLRAAGTFDEAGIEKAAVKKVAKVKKFLKSEPTS